MHRQMSSEEASLARVLLNSAWPERVAVSPQWSAAASDCTEAVALDDKYVKAYSRRGTAYEEADDLERSLADYNRVCLSAVAGKFPLHDRWCRLHGCGCLIDIVPGDKQNLLDFLVQW